MQLTKSELITLQSIVINAQELMYLSATNTVTKDAVEALLMCISSASAELCIEHSLDPAIDGF